MKVDGQCHCGAIAYEADVDPARVQICHCTDCQTLTGTAYRVSAPAEPAKLKFTRGAPKIYIKTAESGRKRAQAFCGECGSPIYSAAPENTPVYFLRVGGMKQRAELPPQRAIWCDSALPWTEDISDLPQVARE